MFDPVSAFGARAVVWRSESPPRLPVTIVVPGRRAPEEVAAQRLGMLIPRLEPVDDAARERLFDDSAELAYAGAVLELGCWRGRLASAQPGPALAEALADRPARLAPGVGRGDLLRDQTWWPEAVLSSLQARARLIAHLQAEQYADAAELSAHYPAAHEFLATEIALALSCTESSAQAMLAAAEAFRDRLPATLAALSDGTIDEEKAHAILAATTSSDAEVAGMVELGVLPGADRVTARTLRRRAERAVIACDPAGARDRHHRRTRDRYVSRWAESDGMATLKVYSTAQDIATIHEAITALADADSISGDGRDLGNRRVDALVHICTDILAGGGWKHLALPHGRPRRNRPQIRVTMPLNALLGGDDPCELDGHGPITAQQARAIAADGELRRLVCDPLSGTLLDYGLTRYEAPESLKEHIRVRDGTCVMPGCGQPAGRCDTDHVIPARPHAVTGRPTLGPTNAGNLAAECRHHHLSKDGGGGYMLRRDDDGGHTWTTPLGRAYRQEPTRLWHPPEGNRPSPATPSNDLDPPPF